MVLEHLCVRELKSLRSLRDFCNGQSESRLDNRSYGFKAETAANTYYIRCCLGSSDYNMYAYVFDSQQLSQYLASQEQQVGTAEPQPEQQM